MIRTIQAISALAGLAAAQRVGDSPEVHPRLTTWKCTTDGGCVEKNSAIVIDALSHWVHQAEDTSLGCGNWGEAANATVCPDKETCQQNCVMEGIADYSQNGVVTMGDALHLDHLRDDGSVLSPRVYLLSEDEETYEMLQLTGQELSFDVDASKLPCGMNGALYLSEMEADGGMSDLNTGGAYYGTGYCDAQCFTTPFINGEGNIEGYGSCCNEMDIWEANGRATHIAPHPCNQTGLYECTPDECAYEGVCDKDGCGYNPYHLGNPDYYGFEKKVDTSKPFTVVTQFPANEEGKLMSINRLYIQDGVVIENANANFPDNPEQDFLNDDLCAANGARRYGELGATGGMGDALSRGMVLAFSVWWDEGGNMEWLDSGSSGPCAAGEGAPSNIAEVQPDTSVVFSNIRWGDIDSTFARASNSTMHSRRRY
jgi:cellulase